MKTKDCSVEADEKPLYRLGRHWNTIQAYLLPGIEDDIGELGEETRKFVQTCELLIRDEMFAKYRWCGNGRPPHSRISMFKAYILLIARIQVRGLFPPGQFLRRSHSRKKGLENFQPAAPE